MGNAAVNARVLRWSQKSWALDGLIDGLPGIIIDVVYAACAGLTAPRVRFFVNMQCFVECP
jgi:hypothetical protein